MAKNNSTATNPLLREQLLDALERCFDRFGIRKTTLADVAEEAGVSRTTIYRYFPDRQALIDQVVLRNIDYQWATIGKMVKGASTLEEWLIESMMLFQRQYKKDGKVNLYIRVDGMTAGLQIALSKQGLEVVINHFEDLFVKAERDGRLAPKLKKEDIAEWIHRTNHTLLAHPSQAIKREKDLRRWLSAQIYGGFARPE